MAVLSITQLSADVKLGLWKIVESVPDLLQRFPHLEEQISKYHNVERKRQKLAVYALLYAMIGNGKQIIEHNDNGKPLLKNYCISISDTKGYVAVIISKKSNVAVDIEYFSNRVNRIAHRFIREDEVATTTEEQLIFWSVKETIYKYYSEQNLHYCDMRLHSFSLEKDNRVLVDNLYEETSRTVYYYLNSEYALTYTY